MTAYELKITEIKNADYDGIFAVLEGEESPEHIEYCEIETDRAWGWRYGDAPEDGKSVHYNAFGDGEEKGVSMMVAISPDGEIIEADSTAGFVATICHRPKRFYFGDIVGTGADGEALFSISQ